MEGLSRNIGGPNPIEQACNAAQQKKDPGSPRYVGGRCVCDEGKNYSWVGNRCNKCPDGQKLVTKTISAGQVTQSCEAESAPAGKTPEQIAAEAEAAKKAEEDRRKEDERKAAEAAEQERRRAAEAAAAEQKLRDEQAAAQRKTEEDSQASGDGGGSAPTFQEKCRNANGTFEKIDGGRADYCNCGKNKIFENDKCNVVAANCEGGTIRQSDGECVCPLGKTLRADGKGCDTEAERKAAEKAQSAADKERQAEYKKEYDALTKKIRKRFDELEKKALNKNNGDVNDRIGDIITEGQKLVDECDEAMLSLLNKYKGTDSSATIWFGSVKNDVWEDDKHKLCGNYDGFKDGVQKNIDDVVEKLKKEQGRENVAATKAEQKAMKEESKAVGSVNASADKVTKALNDATAAVNANSNTQLKSAAAALKGSAVDLKKTISGKNSDTMFNELTQSDGLKGSANGLIDALGKASSDNEGLQGAESKLTDAMGAALGSANVSELGDALDKAAAALDEAAGFLDKAIKEDETAAEGKFKSDFDALTQAFNQAIAKLKK
jgi:hypothetical protein